MAEYKHGWEPTDDTPMATHVEVSATVRNDHPVAVVKFRDFTGDSREIQLGDDAVYELFDGLTGYLLTRHRNRHR